MLYHRAISRELPRLHPIRSVPYLWAEGISLQRSPAGAFWVQPTFSCYISQQSFFCAFWGEATPAVTVALTVLTGGLTLQWVQCSHLLSSGGDETLEMRGPPCSVTSWWNEAALRFLIPAGLKPEWRGFSLSVGNLLSQVNKSTFLGLPVWYNADQIPVFVLTLRCCWAIYLLGELFK